MELIWSDSCSDFLSDIIGEFLKENLEVTSCRIRGKTSGEIPNGIPEEISGIISGGISRGLPGKISYAQRNFCRNHWKTNRSIFLRFLDRTKNFCRDFPDDFFFGGISERIS